MKTKDFFVCLSFFVENKIMQIIIDQIEINKNFICINYNRRKGCSFFFYLEALFYKEANIYEIIEKLNLLRVSLEYKPLTYIKNLDEIPLGVLSSKKVNNQDWLLANKHVLKPIIINNYYIYDENYYSFEKKTLIPIKINASYAFGSGYHETTKNCINAISIITKKKQINRFLDYGTGSGIIGICLNKKNQKSKTRYIDNDYKAIQLAKINIKKNNLKSQGNIFHSTRERYKYHKENYYDAIVANILFGPLKNLVKEFSLLLKRNSYLIISGILKSQKNYIINKYRKFNFYFYMIYTENNWVTIIFRKK